MVSKTKGEIALEAAKVFQDFYRDVSEELS